MYKLYQMLTVYSQQKQGKKTIWWVLKGEQKSNLVCIVNEALLAKQVDIFWSAKCCVSIKLHFTFLPVRIDMVED